MNKLLQYLMRCARDGHARVCFLLAALGLLCSGHSQTLVQGLCYYAVVNSDSGQVIQRGKAGSQGIAFNQLILAPDTHYRIWVLQASTLLIGYIDITSPPNGGTAQLPQIVLGTDISPDDDNDGLPNDAEFVVGTDPHNPSTRGDGILDGAAVREGLDPLNGKAVITGIIANSPTPFEAVDICAVNDIVVTADGTNGISVFNVFNGMSPKVIAQLNLPGYAAAVSSSGNLVAVAAGSAGLVVVDIADPPAAKIIQQVALGGYAQAVLAVGNVAYIGLTTHFLVSIDMPSGTILGRVSLNAPVDDIAISGDALYVLTDTALVTLPALGGPLQVANSISAPGIIPHPRRRVFAGTAQVFAVHDRGYTVFSLANPLAPTLIQDIVTAQVGWKQIVANGSGMGLAAVGPNSSDDGPHNVSLYSLSPDGTTNQFITTFITAPGIATAIAIYNGIGYVAARSNGMDVVNYLSYDSLGVPPTISLSGSFSLQPAQVLEDQLARVTANVSDDVQVRNVEFYIDGIKVFTAGHYPFEFHFNTPEHNASKTNFILQARASDTGGNATWTSPISVQLLPNTTPPAVLGVYPPRGGIMGAVGFIAIYFNKPVLGSSLNQNTIQIRSAGPDKLFGTADDSTITNGVINFRSDLNGAIVSFSNNLAPGLYQVLVNGISDALGDVLTVTNRWTFGVLGTKDTDQDGIPDDMEIALGLNPFNPSTFNDGILDGDRDLDNDGLKTSWELFWGYNPTNFSTLNDGISDGLRDPDHDGLNNIQEQAAGTNPLVADTDGDGWNDEQEVTAGSDPLDPNSRPKLQFLSSPGVGLVVPEILPVGSLGTAGGLAYGVTVAKPPASIVLPGVTTTPGLFEGTTVARPLVGIVVPGFTPLAGFGLNSTVAEPPVSVKIGP